MKMGSHAPPPQYILITGAGGFVGQQLAASLLTSSPSIHLILADVFKPQFPKASDSISRTQSISSNLTLPSSVSSLLSLQKWHACYLLHGIMSGGAEANLDLGLAVNIDSHRFVLDYLRKYHPGVIVVSGKTIPIPQSSYGAEKDIVETLVNDYSRRGLIDGRVVRLPTVIVRPGAPSAAASSFASGIVREPLKGLSSVLPVSRELEMWVCSPGTVVSNLIAIKDVPKARFGIRNGRVVNLPGQILEALEAVGEKQAMALVKERRDQKVEAIVASWLARFDIYVARGLGMAEDVSLTEAVESFARSLK
ncbi:NAD-dependent epimerase/dehydratase [Clohesyomyces aquaticus]|uniref:NAD-dependent epimerase/dehydratase n=1 Tax=Clohesyomyces aquaticus TaxID=1231657 RepID=A0A1Y1Y4J9_9PLEO|nr:NAD-dependent epimerase/dehydratase [Clohesyomyces aquaticus]